MEFPQPRIQKPGLVYRCNVVVTESPGLCDSLQTQIHTLSFFHRLNEVWLMSPLGHFLGIMKPWTKFNCTMIRLRAIKFPIGGVQCMVNYWSALWCHVGKLLSCLFSNHSRLCTLLLKCRFLWWLTNVDFSCIAAKIKRLRWRGTYLWKSLLSVQESLPSEALGDTGFRI